MTIKHEATLLIKSDLSRQEPQQNCGIVYALTIEEPHTPVIGWLNKDASLGEAIKYIQSLSVEKVFEVTFIPFVSKRKFAQAYPFLIPTITWKSNGDVSIDASITSRYRNRYLPQITTANRMTRDHPLFSQYADLTKGPDSFMDDIEHKEFTYNGGTYGKENWPKWHMWNDQLETIQMYRNTKRPKQNTIERRAWEWLVKEYGYKHQEDSPDGDEWRHWNNANYCKGNKRCTDLNRWHDWEKFVMENWIIGYFNNEETPKYELQRSIKNYLPDFDVDKIIGLINKTRRTQGWIDVYVYD